MMEPNLEHIERIMANLRTADDVATDAVAAIREALESQAASAAKLGRRIWWLNVWLLLVTVAIGGMTLVQAAAAWKMLAGGGSAWVLWQETTYLGSGYTAMLGTASERECGVQRVEYEQRPRPETIDKNAAVRYLCLPDTVDPRGPKGK